MIAKVAYKRLQDDDRLLRDLNNQLDHSDDTDGIIRTLLIDPVISTEFFREIDLHKITMALEKMIHIGYRCGELETQDH